MKHFDEQAHDWDNNIEKVERAGILAKEIIDYIQPNKSFNALEFGCGTGLLSYQLKDVFKTITLVDTSEGMMKVLREKIERENIKNFDPTSIDLLSEKPIKNNYDVIYTLMTLHHISNIDKIFKVFDSILKTGGYLCIADLVHEDGSFHSDHSNFEGHNGFDKDELSSTLRENGFTVEYYKIFYTIVKQSEDEIKKYPLFLMICKK